MSVHIALDESSGIYTNLDVVSGRVILKLPREESITAVIAKLECESRTRLAAPNEDRRNAYDTELEVHKVGLHNVASGLIGLYLLSCFTRQQRSFPLPSSLSKPRKGFLSHSLPDLMSTHSSSRSGNSLLSCCVHAETRSFPSTMLALRSILSSNLSKARMPTRTTSRDHCRQR